MAGLFSRAPKDKQPKENVRMLKEFQKSVREKKYGPALGLGKKYLQRVPGNHDVLFSMGGMHYMRGEYRTAISYFGRALEIGSYDVEVLLLKAYSHQKLSENGDAADCCRRILEVDPKNQKVADLLRGLGC